MNSLKYGTIKKTADTCPN